RLAPIEQREREVGRRLPVSAADRWRAGTGVPLGPPDPAESEEEKDTEHQRRKATEPTIANPAVVRRLFSISLGLWRRRHRPGFTVCLHLDLLRGDWQRPVATFATSRRCRRRGGRRRCCFASAGARHPGRAFPPDAAARDWPGRHL